MGAVSDLLKSICRYFLSAIDVFLSILKGIVKFVGNMLGFLGHLLGSAIDKVRAGTRRLLIVDIFSGDNDPLKAALQEKVKGCLKGPHSVVNIGTVNVEDTRFAVTADDNGNIDAEYKAFTVTDANGDAVFKNVEDEVKECGVVELTLGSI